MKKIIGLCSLCSLLFISCLSVAAQSADDALRLGVQPVILTELQTPAPFTPNAAVTNVIGALPQALSYSNTTIKVDVGEFTSGLNGTTVAQSYLRGTYNLNQHFGLGLEGDFGANNVLNAAFTVIEVRKVLTDNAEIYAAGGAGWSWMDRRAEGFLGVGSRVVPFQSLNALCAGAEVDVGITSDANHTPGIGLKLFAGWRF